MASDPIKNLASQIGYSKDTGVVVIDSGHGMVVLDEEKAKPEFSEQDAETLRTALELRRMIKSQRRVILSICFKDLRFNPESKKLLKTGLPKLVDDLSVGLEVAPEDLVVTLQSQNSNFISNVLKKHRRRVRQLSDTELINNYHALFSLNEREFALIHPFLTYDKNGNGDPEGSTLDRIRRISPGELRVSPWLKLKLLKRIVLRDSTIRCPATYAGLLLRVARDVSEPISDFIAIQHRGADSDIGEKVLGGALAGFTFEPKFTNRFHAMTRQSSGNSWEYTSCGIRDLRVEADLKELQRTRDSRSIECAC